YRELNRPFVPTLVYNSATAFPHPTVMANVAVPAGAAAPDTVRAILSVESVQVATAWWPGSSFTPGKPMRVSVGYDASSVSSGVHTYSLQVTSKYAGGSYSTTVGDTLVIVNRSYGPFGSGWWLAGLESVTSAP